MLYEFGARVAVVAAPEDTTEALVADGIVTEFVPGPDDKTFPVKDNVGATVITFVPVVKAPVLLL